MPNRLSPAGSPLLLPASSAGAPPAVPPGTELRYVGSSTIGGFVRDAPESYPARFEIDASSESDGGELAILESAADLGGVAREPGPEVAASGAEATLIGRDAIAVIVHPDVPLAGLALAEIRGLFDGTIADWSAVGGPALPVRPFVVGEESATRRVLEERVLAGAPLGPCEVVRPDEQLVAEVARTPGGVGAISLSFLDAASGVRPIAVDGEAPEVTNFDYPLARPLYLVWRRGDPAVAAFVDWAVGEQGQRVLMRRLVGTDVVGSVRAAEQAAPLGTLVVNTETLEVLDGGIAYYPHRPYEVRTRHGEFLRRVRNHRGNNDEQPARVALEPGVYLVRTEVRGRGDVESFVTISAGRTTELDVLARLEEVER